MHDAGPLRRPQVAQKVGLSTPVRPLTISVLPTPLRIRSTDRLR